MRIICGTDFSKPAAQAATAAAAFAAQFEDSLQLVHVREGTGLAALDPGVLATLTAGVAGRLGTEADRLRRLGAVVKEQVVTGVPDEELVALSRRRGARLLVLSSLGRRAPGRWLIGSVSERAAEGAALPTLVVRDAAPFTAWAAGKRALKVLVAVDFTIPAAAALRWVKELQRVGPCDIIVAHVAWPPAEQARLGLDGPLSLTELPPAAQQGRERELMDTVREILGADAARVRVVPGWGRADAALLELAGQESADLVVTGTRQQHGLERLAGSSVSRGLLRYAPMSVVCVPAPEAVAHGVGALPRLQRVLATTDFSVLGDRAIPYAYAALVHGGVVKLIHVLPPWELPGPLVPHYQPGRLTRAQHQQLAADSLVKLQALIPPQAAACGIVTEVEIIFGTNPATAICQTAEQFGADLICLGTHGRAGLSAAVLGSVANAVMARSKRPLLAVPPTKA